MKTYLIDSNRESDMTKEEIIEKLWGAVIRKKLDIGKSDITAIVDFVMENQEQTSLPEGLDEAAEEATKNKYPDESGLDDHDADAWYQSHRDHWRRAYKYGFKAGAEWRDSQMKMPNSSKLISEWHNVKTILEEKDFRGDEWRLAYNAFMFGFSRGINTQKTEK